jgi:hypothetical protein
MKPWYYDDDAEKLRQRLEKDLIPFERIEETWFTESKQSAQQHAADVWGPERTKRARNVG